MKRSLVLAAVVAVWTAWALGPALQAFVGLDATLLWPEPATGRWVLAALGAVWVLGWSLTALLALRLPLFEGAKAAGLSAVVWALGRGWPMVLGVPLPAPHDLPQRKLQIFLAALFIAALALAVTLLLRSALKLSPWARLSPRQWALRLGALAWGVYLLSGLWTWRWHMTGDAPIYLILASDVAHDHSLDVGPGFQRQEWKRFYDLDKVLQPQEPPQASGTHYIEHRPFTALLMAPFYAWGGIGGALWAQTLLAALTTGLFYSVLRARHFAPNEALLGFALFAFGAPWWSYSVNFHIDAIGGALGWAWFCAWIGQAPGFLLWAAPSALVWTALRFNPTAGLLSLAGAWQQRRAVPRALAGLALFGLAVLGFWLTAKAQFGNADPVAQYQSRGYSFWHIIDPAGLLWRVFGVFLDQEYGLLTYTAPLILAFSGVGLLWRRRDPLLAPLALWLLPYAGLVCVTVWWYGGQNPNRYFIFVIPAMTFLAVEGWRALGFPRWSSALVALGWLCALVLQVLPWFGYSKLDGAAWPLKIVGRALHHDIAWLFPSYLVPNAAAWPWGAGLFILALWLLRKGSQAPTSQP